MISVVERINASIADSPEAALALTDQAAADQYTHRHAVDVTALGLLLARTIFRRDGWVDYRGGAPTAGARGRGSTEVDVDTRAGVIGSGRLRDT